MTVTEEHLALVREIALVLANSIRPIHVEWSDLLDAGMTGLLSAVEKYRPDEGASFRTYAKHRIRGAMLDELRSLDRVSRHTRRLERKVEAARRELIALGLPPNDTEIRLRLGLSQRRWAKLMVDLQSAAMPLTMVSELRCQSPSGEQKVGAQEIAAILAGALNVLPPRTRRVFHLIYQCEMKMEDIARVIGVHASRVSQIHTEGLLRLRAGLRRKGLSAASFF